MIQRMQKSNKQKGEKRDKIDKNSAFIEYKKTEEALAIEQTIVSCRRNLTASRDELKLKTERINFIKQHIDAARVWLERKQETKRQAAVHKSMAPGFHSHTDGFDETPHNDSEIIEEDELAKIRELKDLKRDYRDLYKDLKELKNAINFSQQAIDNSKQRMVTEFEVWYDETFEDQVLPIKESKSNIYMSTMKSQRSGMPSIANLASKSIQKVVRDPAMDEDLMAGEEDIAEREGIDTDENALAFIRAKKKVMQLNQARKHETK